MGAVLVFSVAERVIALTLCASRVWGTAYHFLGSSGFPGFPFCTRLNFCITCLLLIVYNVCAAYKEAQLFCFQKHANVILYDTNNVILYNVNNIVFSDIIYVMPGDIGMLCSVTSGCHAWWHQGCHARWHQGCHTRWHQCVTTGDISMSQWAISRNYLS